jgi:hypothetical protein
MAAVIFIVSQLLVGGLRLWQHGTYQARLETASAFVLDDIESSCRHACGVTATPHDLVLRMPQGHAIRYLFGAGDQALYRETTSGDGSRRTVRRRLGPGHLRITRCHFSASGRLVTVRLQLSMGERGAAGTPSLDVHRRVALRNS